MSGESSEQWTVLKLLDWTRDYFDRSGVDEPRLCAEVLLAHVLGCQRIMLYTQFDRIPDPDKLAVYRELVRRAANHEPTAYLVGWRAFYSLKFKVTPDVLVPRPETEQLVCEAETHLRGLGRAGLMWDICTGSGCVAIASAVQVADLRVLATDICSRAVEVARENAAAHDVSSRLRCRTADLATLPDDCGDLEAGTFDVITANPPYVADGDEVAESVRHEPHSALYAGADGLECISRLIPQVPPFLRSGGIFAMEFGQGQAGAVSERVEATGQFDRLRILKDHQGIERTIVAVRK